MFKIGRYYIMDVWELRDKTKVGSRIRFKKEIEGSNKGKTIDGVVRAKYPHIFELSDGNTYTWKDYLLGREI